MTRTNADRAHLARYLSDREPNDPNNLHAIQLGECTEPAVGRKERKMTTDTRQVKIGDKALLKGYGHRIWRVNEICEMEDGTTRYLVVNVEPSDSSSMFAAAVKTMTRLVAREGLTMVVPQPQDEQEATQ